MAEALPSAAPGACAFAGLLPQPDNDYPIVALGSGLAPDGLPRKEQTRTFMSSMESRRPFVNFDR